MNTIIRIIACCLAAALALTAAGCGSEPNKPADAGATALVVVTGNHEGNPAPAVTDALRPVVERAMWSGRVAVVTGDGAPALLSKDELRLDKLGGTRAGNESVVRRNTKRLNAALVMPPRADGADTWAAVAKAANELRGMSGVEERIIVVLDNGLADRGVLNFAQLGSLEMDPTDAVGQLRDKGLLLDLQGITVHLSGLGSTVDPQAPLSPKAHTRLTEIWVQALEASAATVVIDPTPRDGASVDTVGKRVRPTPVPEDIGLVAPQPCQSSETVFDGRSSVTFIGDLDVFVDQDAAHAALRPLAQWLSADPDRTAHLRGTTAGARTEDERRALGLARAEAVAAYLRSQGVLAGQLTTEGVGTDFPEYVPDQLPDGTLDESIAAGNRSIRVLLTDPC